MCRETFLNVRNLQRHQTNKHRAEFHKIRKLVAAEQAEEERGYREFLAAEEAEKERQQLVCIFVIVFVLSN